MKKICVVLLLTTLLASSSAYAQEQPQQCINVVNGNADIDAIDAKTRTHSLRKSLESDASNARLWTWSWVGVGAATTLGNGLWAAGSDYDGRVDRIGAATGGVMLAVSTLVDPLRVTDEADVAEAVDLTKSASPNSDPCIVTHYVERSLVKASDDESRRKGILGHAIPIGGSIAGGLVLGVGYGHWAGGAINAAIGIVLSEIKLLTQPMGSVRALERYRSGILGTGDSPAVGALSGSWAWKRMQVSPAFLGNGGGGLSLSMVY